VKAAALLAAALLAIASRALADPSNPCNVPAPNTPMPYVENGPNPCAPIPSSTSTAPTIRVNDAGVMVWWYCKAAGRWSAQWGAATWAFIGAAPKAADINAVLTSSTPVATLNAIAAGYPRISLSDPSLTPVWCPFQAEMLNATPPPDPPPAVLAKPVLTVN
jgi:hypothetical protein